MKNINHFLTAAMAVLAVATSCNKATTKTPSVEKTSGESLTISVGGGNAKSIYRGGSDVLWVKDDALMVFNANNDGCRFTTTASAKASADFTCDDWVGGIPVIATHTSSPSGCICRGEESKIVTTFLNPTQKIVNANSSSKDAACSVGVVTEDNGSYVIEEMKNVYGLIGFKVGRSDIAKITMTGNNNEYLAGWVDVDYNNDVSWTESDIEGKSLSKEIVVTVAGSGGQKDNKTLFNPNTTYYIAVLPQTFSKGFSLELETADGTTDERKIESEFVLARSKCRSFTKTIDSGLFTTVTLDCTDADNFRYDNNGVVSKLPTRASTRTYCDGDFWLDGKETYKFTGKVYRWSNTLATDDAASGRKVKLPSISGSVLSAVNVTYSHASEEKGLRTYSIVDETGTSYGECTRNSSTTDPTVIYLSVSKVSGKDLYFKSSGEMCAKFILTYSKACTQ